MNLLMEHFDYTTFFCLYMHGYSNTTKKEAIKAEAETFYISFQILIICMSVVIFKAITWLKTSENFSKPGEREFRI